MKVGRPNQPTPAPVKTFDPANAAAPFGLRESDIPHCEGEPPVAVSHGCGDMSFTRR